MIVVCSMEPALRLALLPCGLQNRVSQFPPILKLRQPGMQRADTRFRLARAGQPDPDGNRVSAASSAASPPALPLGTS
jgi:hypothetical protein